MVRLLLKLLLVSAPATPSGIEEARERAHLGARLLQLLGYARHLAQAPVEPQPTQAPVELQVDEELRREGAQVQVGVELELVAKLGVGLEERNELALACQYEGRVVVAGLASQVVGRAACRHHCGS